jgi:anti-sigma-K factor RskA
MNDEAPGDEARDLAAAGALGALPLHEAAAFDRSVAADAELRAAFEAYQATVESLEQGLARAAAPADLLALIEAATTRRGSDRLR